MVTLESGKASSALAKNRSLVGSKILSFIMSTINLRTLLSAKKVKNSDLSE